MNIPHGEKLINRIASFELRKEVLLEAVRYKTIPLNNNLLNDVRNIALGAYSPLEGFLRKKDFECVINSMRLSNGILWPIPIVLDVSQEIARTVRGEMRILLTDAFGQHF